MKKWEYLVLGVSGNIVRKVNNTDAEGLNQSFFGPPSGSTHLFDYLDWLGDIGWELAASNPQIKPEKGGITNFLIFKRAK